MTTAEIIAYYVGLLIIQYRNLTRASATIEALVTPAIMDQIGLTVQNAFQVSTAVGVQLDIIGKYVGVTRTGYTFTGPITLDDDDFRQLIMLAIVRNNGGSSLADIQNLIHLFFPGTILVFDFQNMQMNYYFDSAAGSLQLAQMFLTQGLLPKPMGVELGTLIYGHPITTFFGFQTYTLPPNNRSPFNTYANYNLAAPWLSYSNAVII